MKKIVFILLIMAPTLSFSQLNDDGKTFEKGLSIKQNTNAISIRGEVPLGLLEIDYEKLSKNKIGYSFGLNLFGANVALKYHFKPLINSSSLGLKVGVGNDIIFKFPYYTVTPFIEYRSKRHFELRWGGGIINIDGGVAVGLNIELGIGIYFPL
jgi:hypothetical protein